MKNKDNLELDLKYKKFLEEPIDRKVLAKYGIFKRTRRPKRKVDIVVKLSRLEYVFIYERPEFYKGEFNRINGSMALNYKTKDDE